MVPYSIRLNAKERCSHQTFKTLPIEPLYFIPVVSQDLEVSLGATLFEGQVLNKDYGDNILIHSPVDGIFQEIQNIDNKEYMVIHTTSAVEPPRYNVYDPFSQNPDELIEEIRKAGIVGMGGGGFPTFKKLQFSKGKVSTLIVNAVECEPFLSSDTQLLFENTLEIIQGAKAICHIVGATKIYLAIHRNTELIHKLQPFLDEHIVISECSNTYPSGYEKTLIQNILGVELPFGKFPADAEVLVQNVATVKAIYDAVFHHKPLIERSLTVDGAFCAEHGNFIIKIGTPISTFMRPFADHDAYVILRGGPMMGQLVGMDLSISKTTNGLLMFEGASESPEQECISCALCVTHCPMRLEPYRLIDMIRHQELEEASSEGMMECIACNVCSYVCPSSIPLGRTIFQGKNTIIVNNR